MTKRLGRGFITLIAFGHHEMKSNVVIGERKCSKTRKNRRCMCLVVSGINKELLEELS